MGLTPGFPRCLGLCWLNTRSPPTSRKTVSKHQIIRPDKSPSFPTSVIMCSTYFQFTAPCLFTAASCFSHLCLSRPKADSLASLPPLSGRVFPSPAVFNVDLSFYFPTPPCFPLCLLRSRRPPSPPFQPMLHCFDIWPNYSDNCGSCSLPRVWRCWPVSRRLYRNIVALCSTWPSGKGALAAPLERELSLYLWLFTGSTPFFLSLQKNYEWLVWMLYAGLFLLLRTYEGLISSELSCHYLELWHI